MIGYIPGCLKIEETDCRSNQGEGSEAIAGKTI